jgi:hypothetical protein
MTFDFHPEAETEFLEAIAYYESCAPGLGEDFSDKALYASLFKKSPVGNGYTAGLDPAVAKHLQTVAWDTVKDFFKIQ